MRRDSRDTPQEVRRARLTWGLAAMTVGAIVFLVTLGGAFVIANYKTAEYKCLVEGPHSPLAEISEDSTVLRNARFSVWPLGRECEWRRADGAGTVTADSNNWPGTAVLLVAGSTAVGGLLLTTSAVSAKDRSRRTGGAS